MANVYGTNASERIDALDGVTDGADIIFAYNGNDVIYGRGGDDIIKGGGGADRIDGDAGYDTASYADSGEGVTVVLYGNGAGAGAGGTAQGDTLISIENVTGSAYNDQLFGDDGVNVLVGNGGQDVISGNGNNDIIYGGDEVDNLWGDSGLDTIYGDAGGDVIYGNQDNDTLHGGTGDDHLWGGTENDKLYGDADPDWLAGGDGNDILDGGTGNDIMIGGAGNDTYYVDNPGDTITEGVGPDNDTNDTVYALVDYTLGPTAWIEVLSLQMGNAISATGNNLSQAIFGNALDNILEGGGGAGSMNGLGGNDTFVFRPGQSNGSVVYEFQGNGAAFGDTLKFIGFGSQGASLEQASAKEWIIHSADGIYNEVITVYADGGFTGATLDPSDLIFFL